MVGLIFRGGLSEIDRLAEPTRRAAVVSTFFAAAYLGLGLPPVLTGLVSQLAGTVDASAWTSAIMGLILAAAIVIVVRAFGTAHGTIPPGRPATAGAARRTGWPASPRCHNTVTPRPRHRGHAANSY